MPYSNPIARKEYQKIWNKKFGRNNSRKRRLKHILILNRIKLEEGCLHCGYDSNPKALEFHHINPEDKSFTIAQKLTTELIKILRETEKCIVLCSNCHRIEEHRLNNNSLY